jgi:hypothetical protein
MGAGLVYRIARQRISDRRAADRRLVTDAVWPTNNGLRVFGREWLAISRLHTHRRDRNLGAPIDQAWPRFGVVEEVIRAHCRSAVTTGNSSRPMSVRTYSW